MTRLKIRVTKTPQVDSAVSAREFRPSRRMMRTIFGTTQPRHKMAVLLPGSDAACVEVRLAEDDVMAVADEVGVTAKAGETR